MSPLLIGALLALLLWVMFTFVIPAGLGIVHVLLAVGVVLLMRWWVDVGSRE